jgi:AraC family transcriptional regulator of arabinose operon
LLPDDVRRRLKYFTRALDAAVYVRENLGRPLRLEDLAARAGMTPNAFSRYFADKVGMTLSNFIKTLRIERALSELESQDGAISDLAEQTGYQSCCSFTRAFKDVMGETPSQYRRRMLFEAEERSA